LSAADYTGEVESPFLDEELFVGESEEEWEPRAAALAAETPFQTAFERDRPRIDPPEMEEPESFDEKLFSEEEPSTRAKTKKRTKNWIVGEESIQLLRISVAQKRNFLKPKTLIRKKMSSCTNRWTHRLQFRPDKKK